MRPPSTTQNQHASWPMQQRLIVAIIFLVCQYWLSNDHSWDRPWDTACNMLHDAQSCSTSHNAASQKSTMAQCTMPQHQKSLAAQIECRGIKNHFCTLRNTTARRATP